MAAPTSLIINSAFTEPQQYWAENPDRNLRLEPTRRAAGYEIIDTRENTRRQVPIPLVDTIRDRVRQWRADGLWLSQTGERGTGRLQPARRSRRSRQAVKAGAGRIAPRWRPRPSYSLICSPLLP